MALKDYLTTEVALDHNDGILTRREALRRLGLMGLSLSAGAALLAACSTDGPSAAASSSTAAGSTAASAATSAPTATAPPAVQLPSSTTVSTTPVSTTTVTAATSRTAELIKFTGAAGMLIGAYAAAATPKGAVLIIHENKGLTPHFKALQAGLRRPVTRRSHSTCCPAKGEQTPLATRARRPLPSLQLPKISTSQT